MKTPPHSQPERDWNQLLQKARADVAPRVDVRALLRVVRAAAPMPAQDAGWLAEFSALFASARALRVCLGAAGALAFLTSWEVWNVWQALPWAQFLAASGGLP